MATKKAAKKSAAKKSSSTRKYSPTAGKDVEREMKAMKQGKLKSGRSGKKVTNPKAGDRDRLIRGTQGRQEGAPSAEALAKIRRRYFFSELDAAGAAGAGEAGELEGAAAGAVDASFPELAVSADAPEELPPSLLPSLFAAAGLALP
jgi:hypothetical protein